MPPSFRFRRHVLVEQSPVCPTCRQLAVVGMNHMNAYHAGAAAGAAAATLCVAARFGTRGSAPSQRRLGGVLTGLAGSPDATAASAPASGQQLAGKVALITGGGTGVGKVTALAYAAEGAHVVLAGRRPGPIEEVAAECEALGVQALAVPTDLGDPVAVEALFAACKDKFGRLDILFNNAGMGAPSKPLEDLEFGEWNAVVSANLTGSFLCTQQAFKLMKSQSPMGGRIINNGSISADRPRPNSAPYTATKHAISGLTKSTSLVRQDSHSASTTTRHDRGPCITLYIFPHPALHYGCAVSWLCSQDGRKYNIACGQIDIGNALTDMTARMSGGVPQADGTIKEEPTMDATDVAKACVYMASLPLEANVLFMTVMASAMPLVGRG